MLHELNRIPVYVTCDICAGFDDQKDYCTLYKMEVDPYIQMYGCGKGEEDIPF